MVRKLQKSPGDTRYSNGAANTVSGNRSKVLDKDEPGRERKTNQSTQKRVDWEKAWERSDRQKYDLMSVVRDAFTILFELSEKDLNESTSKDRQLHQITTKVVAAFLKNAYDESI